MVDLFNIVGQIPNYKNKECFVQVKQGDCFEFSKAILPADISIVLISRKNTTMRKNILLLDVSRLESEFDNDRIVHGLRTKYGEPTSKNTQVILYSTKGFNEDLMKWLRDGNCTWLYLMRINGEDKIKTVLNRANHDHSSYSNDWGKLVDDDTTFSQAFTGKQFYSPLELLEQCGVPVKSKYRFKADYLSNEQIQKAVDNLLDGIGLDVSANHADYLERICKHLNLPIQKLKMPIEQMGFYDVDESIIYVNSELCEADPSYRQRFTIAHEIGHHILHKEKMLQYQRNCLWDTDATFCNADIGESEEAKLEVQANKFATILLMPEKELRRQFARCLNHLLESDNSDLSEYARNSVLKGKIYIDKQYCNQYPANTLLMDLSNTLRVSKQALRIRLSILKMLEEEPVHDIKSVF